MTFSRGDIVYVNLNPIRGHEQGSRRPVVVINSVPLPGNLNLIMPITSHKKDFPFEVELDSRTKTHGVILCFQMRAADLTVRDTEYVEQLPKDLLALCTEYLQCITSDVD